MNESETWIRVKCEVTYLFHEALCRKAYPICIYPDLRGGEGERQRTQEGPEAPKEEAAERVPSTWAYTGVGGHLRVAGSPNVLYGRAPDRRRRGGTEVQLACSGC